MVYPHPILTCIKRVNATPRISSQLCHVGQRPSDDRHTQITQCQYSVAKVTPETVGRATGQSSLYSNETIALGIPSANKFAFAERASKRKAYSNLRWLRHLNQV